MTMSSKTLQLVYAICAVAGVVLTWYFNIQFTIEHGGFSLATYINENYVNNASASITNDLLVVVAVFLIWLFVEARRLQIPHWWLYLILTFVVAIAFTLPLFLLNRERRLAEIANSVGQS